MACAPCIEWMCGIKCGWQDEHILYGTVAETVADTVADADANADTLADANADANANANADANAEADTGANTGATADADYALHCRRPTEWHAFRSSSKYLGSSVRMLLSTRRIVS